MYELIFWLGDNDRMYSRLFRSSLEAERWVTNETCAHRWKINKINNWD